MVVGQCADNFVEMMRDFIGGDASTLPSSESLDLLLGMMESAVNIYGIVDLAEEAIELLHEVEKVLIARDNHLKYTYGSQMAFTFAGYLRNHYAFMLLCEQELLQHIGRVSTCMRFEFGAKGGFSYKI